MKAISVVIGLVVIGAGIAATKLWWDLAEEERRIVAINNTRFFQWSGRSADEPLTLIVKPNPQLTRAVVVPPVPRSGGIAIVGKPGTTQPGAVIQVSNLRTGSTVGAYADEAGAFSLTVSARAGDDLRVLATPPARILEAPQPVYLGLESQ